MSTPETHLREKGAQGQDELLDFLRIASISTLPEHAGDVEGAARWVASRLERAGIENVRVIPTERHPLVYGDWLHAPDKPTVLIYGHFDVQPADPLDLWTSPPFEPVVENGRIYARGASDMKGNLLMSILAVEELLREGRLSVNVKFIFEGEEEIGSPNLQPFISANRELLGCDLVISGDGLQYGEEQPSLLIGFKGGCGVQIDVRGPSGDLHSGVYGGAIQNSIHALVRVLDSMRSPEGKILVEGFFDDVVPLSDADREMIAAVPFDEEDYKREIGVDELFGEPGYTTLERAWARPTLEVNGIWGGFQGEGVKTVIPSEAHAKITCRLVPDQDPNRIVELIAAHVRQHAPPGVEIETRPLAFVARPYLMPADHWANPIAARALAEVYGREPVFIRMGGSVPVCETFLTQLGAYTVSLGFGMEDENIHAPNEFYRVKSFERGRQAWVKLLQGLAAS